MLESICANRRVGTGRSRGQDCVIATARAIATQVRVSGYACSSRICTRTSNGRSIARYSPESFLKDRFQLVRALQRSGNDFAAATATDVVKASASLVLTNPDLTDTLMAVETSRRIYQRMLTYTLKKIIKTVEVGLFLSAAAILTRTFIITPTAPDAGEFQIKKRRDRRKIVDATVSDHNAAAARRWASSGSACSRGPRMRLSSSSPTVSSCKRASTRRSSD